MTPDWVRALVLRWLNARSRLDAAHSRWHVIIPELQVEIWSDPESLTAHRWGDICEYSHDMERLTQQQQGGTNDNNT